MVLSLEISKYLDDGQYGDTEQDPVVKQYAPSRFRWLQHLHDRRDDDREDEELQHEHQHRGCEPEWMKDEQDQRDQENQHKQFHG